jgi:DNA-binding NarL/FixJ family response regulator
VARYGLSEAESDILRRAADGESRYLIAAARGSSELTVKKQIVNLLARTMDDSLHEAVARVLRELAGAAHQ